MTTRICRKRIFRPKLFRLSDSTGRSKRNVYLFPLELPVEKASRKRVVEPIAPLIPPQKHTHAPRQCPTTTPTLARLLLQLLLVASQRGTSLVPPASSVYPTMADGSSARYRWQLPTNSYACWSFCDPRPDATARTTQLWQLWT